MLFSIEALNPVIETSGEMGEPLHFHRSKHTHTLLNTVSRKVLTSNIHNLLNLKSFNEKTLMLGTSYRCSTADTFPAWWPSTTIHSTTATIQHGYTSKVHVPEAREMRWNIRRNIHYQTNGKSTPWQNGESSARWRFTDVSP